MVPVGQRVNVARNDDPGLIAPLARSQEPLPQPQALSSDEDAQGALL